MSKRKGSELENGDSQFGTYSFRVEIDGVSAGYFSRVEGFPSESNAVIPTGGNANKTGKRQRVVKPCEITLRDGYTNIRIFHEWILPGNSIPGVHLKKNMSIVQRDNSDALQAGA